MPQNDAGKWMCWRRRRGCSVCGHRYPAEEYDLLECPECKTDRHCRNQVLADGLACRYHGGKSLRGAESGMFVHGKYSKYLPSDLVERYVNFLNDPHRLSLDNEIALTRSLISERIQQLNSMNTAEAWSSLKRLYEELMNAREERKREREERLLHEIGQLLDVGTGAESTRKETMKMIDLERRLIGEQRQLYVDAGEFITRGMAITILGHLIEAVKENVIPLPGGAEATTAIARAATRLLGTLGERRTHAGSSQGYAEASRMAD